MKILHKIFIVILSILLVFLISACGTPDKAPSNDTTIKPPSNATNTEPLDLIFSKEEQNDLSAFASTIEPDYKREMSAVWYNDIKSSADELSQVGIDGTAFLINEIESFTGREDQYLRKGFFSTVIFAVWRTDQIYVLGRAFEYYDNSIFNNFEKECFVGFYKRANELIPQIISSDKHTDLKIKELREFGIFAVPAVVEEINSGNAEYTKFFVEIGLHLNVPEFMETFGDLLLLSEEKHEIIIHHAKAEDFDYKAWLSENEEDLNNLFKFLDAYCAEYEAEQNTK